MEGSSVKLTENLFIHSLCVLPIIAIIAYCLSSNIIPRSKLLCTGVDGSALTTKLRNDRHRPESQPATNYERQKIEALEGFNHKLVDGGRYRPFTPTFHMTMGRLRVLHEICLRFHIFHLACHLLIPFTFQDTDGRC